MAPFESDDAAVLDDSLRMSHSLAVQSLLALTIRSWSTGEKWMLVTCG